MSDARIRALEITVAKIARNYTELGGKMDDAMKAIVAIDNRYAGLDKRISLTEQDIKGNGSPGMKDVIQDIYDIVKENRDKRIEWERGTTHGIRADTCFFLRHQKEEDQVSGKRRHAWSNRNIVMGIIFGFAILFLVQLPSGIIAWRTAVKVERVQEELGITEPAEAVRE